MPTTTCTQFSKSNYRPADCQISSEKLATKYEYKSLKKTHKNNTLWGHVLCNS